MLFNHLKCALYIDDFYGFTLPDHYILYYSFETPKLLNDERQVTNESGPTSDTPMFRNVKEKGASKESHCFEQQYITV